MNNKNKKTKPVLFYTAIDAGIRKLLKRLGALRVRGNKQIHKQNWIENSR